MTGESNLLNLPIEMYQKLEPTTSKLIESYEHFFKSSTFTSIESSPQNINNWFIISSIPTLVIKYYLNIRYHTETIQLDFKFFFEKLSEYAINLIKHIGQVSFLWYKNNILGNDIKTCYFDGDLSVQLEFDLRKNVFYSINYYINSLSRQANRK